MTDLSAMRGHSHDTDGSTVSLIHCWHVDTRQTMARHVTIADISAHTPGRKQHLSCAVQTQASKVLVGLFCIACNVGTGKQGADDPVLCFA